MSDLNTQTGFDGCNLPPERTLVDEGWEWRCNTDQLKAREMVDTYRELGFEVRLVPVNTDLLCDSCDGCKDTVATFSAVYVRKASG